MARVGFKRNLRVGAGVGYSGSHSRVPPTAWL
jgi:hypothetical protein